MKDVVAISRQEWGRAGAAAVMVEKRMRRRELAERRGVTERQGKRLAARYCLAQSRIRLPTW